MASVWKGYISFGMVSIPVQLFAAARAESVHFHLLHKKDLSRVKEVWYCAAEDKAITRRDMVKGYEVSDGEYVTIDDSELKLIAPATETTMEIVQFVRDSEVDPIYFETSYYIAPNEAAGKPYQVFLKALEQTKYSAIARLSMHGHEHPVLIRNAGGHLVLHRLFYKTELHEARKKTSAAKATAKEVELAAELIKHLAGPFRPEQFHDTYRERVEKLIDAKKKGRKLPAVKQQKQAPVIDLMAALRKSLAVKGRRKAA